MIALELKKLGQLFSHKALRSLGLGVAAGSMMLGLGAFAKPASAVTVGGIDLNSQALADELLESFGSFTTSGGTLDSVLLDGQVTTSAFSATPGAFVTLGFSNPILNSVGNDLAIFELGLPDSFRFEINGSEGLGEYLTTETGFETSNPTRSINVALIDFSDFGVAIGDYVSEIKIKLDTISEDFGSTPDIALVAGIRSVPEPSSMLGLLATAGFLAYQRKSKIAKKA
ncbi:PEP-CTERM sorting domain-containing protein [Anabaena sp. UHCC 0451]|uniref:PEP-CTERM sorting domain-containing protein n=1 Tax=Anabaena sp. UHCC 0451 TaxID=2055235 RepID=UPI002B20AD0B|nr:PEP-CTERM sorting domain-containing protein [Anabaena sp. UHCC 0451]MEA5575425.1 PEP-CTERM sorting domain-containing protein [Anabaena sp. UHCC 0451]